LPNPFNFTMKGHGELVFGSGGLLGNHLEWVQL
jgi:hypothetical protein